MSKMKRKIYSVILGTLTALIFTSCEKLGDFGDTNDNPETTSTPATSALLTNVLSDIHKYSVPYLGNLSYPAGIYCQYFAETIYTWYGLYADNPISPMDYYSGDLYDLQNIILLNTDESTKVDAANNGANENQIAIARILRTYIFWVLTDCWGDIPYSDALKGEPDVRYDTQELIYQELLNELSDAVAQFIMEDSNPIKGDIVFDGDITQWRKLANSLRMLISLRLSKRYPLSDDYAASQFRLALKDAVGSIEFNADNFQLAYPGGIFRNPYYIMYDGSLPEVGESATMTSLLETLNNDLRQSAFGADATGAPSKLGVPVGIKYPDNVQWCQNNPTYCYLFHPDVREETAPLFIITASQVLLARAEAADRGWTSETANTIALYEEGITQSFMQWGLDAPDDAYFSSINVALAAAPGTGANLKQIATQQYIAYYPAGVQGWSNWRRTGYPVLSPAVDAINIPPTIPRRYMYGIDDYNLTPMGVEEAAGRLEGGDEMDSRVWWDRDE
jgi:hypothetical protein